jgi:hypothetical protein
MNDRHEWMRSLFEALTSKRLSRNKYFASFERGWAKVVHRRYRVVRALKMEAERLAGIPDSFCRVQPAAEGVHLSLHSPRMRYRRDVALFSHEWEWLNQQAEVRQLLCSPAHVPARAVGHHLPAPAPR